MGPSVGGGGGGGGVPEGYSNLLPHHTRFDAAAHTHRRDRWCMCVPALGLFIVLVSVASAVNHWLATDNGFIVPQLDGGFQARGPGPHLVDFLRFEENLYHQRQESAAQKKKALRRLPDLLSKSKDYTGMPTADTLDVHVSSVLLTPAALIQAEQALEQAGRPTEAQAKLEPYCTWQLDFSMADYAHLPGVAARASLIMPQEAALQTMAWAGKSSKISAYSLSELGARLAVALEAAPKSPVLLDMAALYWRMRGKAPEAVECLRRAFDRAPSGQCDSSALSLANVLYLAEYPEDALRLLDHAIVRSPNTFILHFTRGHILVSLRRLVPALSAFQSAVALEPDSQEAWAALQAVSVSVKVEGVAIRRVFEINTRKASMVLPNDLTWSDFDYETIEDLCNEVVCAEHASCERLDGQCQCNEGYLMVKGNCAKDTRCESLRCLEGEICRSGRCYCRMGFLLSGGRCVPDPCAGISCVENARCNSTTGRCQCLEPWVAQGSQCLTEDCLNVDCRGNAFCQKGLCFCRPGYHPSVDICVEDEPCSRTRCPGNSTCEAHDGHCRCLPGLEADIHHNQCIIEGTYQLSVSPFSFPESEMAHLAEPVPPPPPADAPIAASPSLAAPLLPPPPPAPTTNIHIATSSAPPLPLSSPLPLEESPSIEASTSIPAILSSSTITTTTTITTTPLPSPPPPLVFSDPEPTHALEVIGSQLSAAAVSTAIANLPEHERPDWANEDSCPQHMRQMPAWSEYASTYMPPELTTDAIAALVREASPTPLVLRLPKCAAYTVPFSMYMYDHMAGIASRNDPRLNQGYRPEEGLRRISGHLFGMGMVPEVVGHALAVSMDKQQPTSIVFNMATLFWRLMGVASEALECVRASLHTSSVAAREIPFLNAANILHHAGYLEDAALFARMALQITKEHVTICHFTLANLYSAQNILDLAATHYETALRLQPGFELALQALRTLRCSQWARRRKDKEIAELRARLLQIQEMLGAHDSLESAHLWAQLKTAEHRLEELVAQHHIATLPIDPLRPNPLLEPLPPLETMPVEIAAGHVKEGTVPVKDVEIPCTISTTAATPSGAQRIVLVDFPRVPSVLQLMGAIRIAMANKEIRSAEMDFDDPLWPTLDECLEEREPVQQSTWNVSWAPLAEIQHELQPTSTATTTSTTTTTTTTAASLAVGPVCDCPLPAQPMQSLEHVEGVAKRANLTAPPEADLEDLLASYLSPKSTLKDIGARLVQSLTVNSSSWVALNLAGLYWRVRGNATQSVECFRRAFVQAPFQAKDVALVGLGQVMHAAGFPSDAALLLQMAIQIAPSRVHSHVTMAKLLERAGSLEEAAFFLEVALRQEPSHAGARDQLLDVRCRQRRKV